MNNAKTTELWDTILKRLRDGKYEPAKYVDGLALNDANLMISGDSNAFQLYNKNTGTIKGDLPFLWKSERPEDFRYVKSLIEVAVRAREETAIEEAIRELNATTTSQ